LFVTSELSAKTYTVSTGNQAGSMAVSVWQSGPPINASGRVVHTTSYDGTGVEGNFNVSFPDGSSLTGTFDLLFQSSGTASVQDSGMWSAVQAPASVFSNTWVSTTTMLRIRFFDNQQSLQLKFMVAEDPGLGDYTMPTGAWLNVQRSPRPDSNRSQHRPSRPQELAAKNRAPTLTERSRGSPWNVTQIIPSVHTTSRHPDCRGRDNARSLPT
jgi:hypothetical protein